jgi:hypothetical protein
MTMETVNTESVLVNGAASKAMLVIMRRTFATDVSLNAFDKVFIISPKSS